MKIVNNDKRGKKLENRFGFSQLKPSADCAAALTRMTVCPSCSGITGNVLACGDMCANVMKGCLAQHAALDAEWNHFVGE